MNTISPAFSVERDFFVSVALVLPEAGVTLTTEVLLVSVNVVVAELNVIAGGCSPAFALATPSAGGVGPVPAVGGASPAFGTTEPSVPAGIVGCVLDLYTTSLLLPTDFILATIAFLLFTSTLVLAVDALVVVVVEAA